MPKVSVRVLEVDVPHVVHALGAVRSVIKVLDVLRAAQVDSLPRLLRADVDAVVGRMGAADMLGDLGQSGLELHQLDRLGLLQGAAHRDGLRRTWSPFGARSRSGHGRGWHRCSLRLRKLPEPGGVLGHAHVVHRVFQHSLVLGVGCPAHFIVRVIDARPPLRPVVLCDIRFLKLRDRIPDFLEHGVPSRRLGLCILATPLILVFRDLAQQLVVLSLQGGDLSPDGAHVYGTFNK